jgi:hypothetical protein
MGFLPASIGQQVGQNGQGAFPVREDVEQDGAAIGGGSPEEPERPLFPALFEGPGLERPRPTQSTEQVLGRPSGGQTAGDRQRRRKCLGLLVGRRAVLE